MSKRKDMSWSVYRLAAKPKHLGSVQVPDEKSTLKRAFEDLDIREAERFKISVRSGR